MKAIAFRYYGPSTVLQYTDVTKPVIQPDELLVRVRAAGVNPADWRVRNGQFRRAVRIKMPFVPGSDIAGEVEQVGSRVRGFQIAL